MPNQNQPDPNQGTPQSVTPPSFSPQSDLPPLPPDFQNLPEEKPVVSTPPQQANENPVVQQPVVDESGSAAPPDIDISSVISKPKKKFGGGKIIATILGLFLLVGGVGAGIVLTQQPQLLQQKASTTITCTPTGYGCYGTTCYALGGGICGNTGGAIGYCCNAATSDSNCNSGKGCGSGGGGTPTPIPTTSSGTSACKVCDSTLGCVSSGKSPCSANLNQCSQNGDCSYCTENEAINCGQNGQHCVSDKNGGHCEANPTPVPTATGNGGTGNCSSIPGCSGNSCSVGSAFNSSSCYVEAYTCPDIKAGGVSCDESTGGTIVKNYASSASFSASCGTEQIDVNCSVCGFNGGTNSGSFLSIRHASACSSTPPPSTHSPAPSCTNIKAFKGASTTAMTSSDLSSLQVGDSVTFCAYPSLAKGTFTVNGVSTNEVGTACAPAAGTPWRESCLCMPYTVPTGVNTFNVSAVISN